MQIKLRLTSEDDQVKKKRIEQAVKRKKAATETMDEAWQRIFRMKNTQADEQRLREVKAAMELGLIGRHPADAGKRFSKAEALRIWQRLQEVKREKKLQKMVEETPSNYWLITDEETLEEFLRILDCEDEIVFDVETTGTDVWNDYIVGHVISAVKADIHAYIPTRHKTTSRQLPHDYVTARLKPYYENPAIGKIAHNAKFDIHMLDRDGIDLQGLTWDTQEAMKILNENEPTFALKPLVTKYLGIESHTYEDLFGKVGFHEVSDLKVALAYAAKDGDITLKLRDFQRKHLRRFPKMYEYYITVEVPLIKTLVHMESTGYVIDTEFAENYGRELQEEIERLRSEITAVLGEINIDSPHQLRPALEKVIGEKLESTDAKKVLKPIAHKYPIIQRILDYKEKVKLHSTYISVLPKLINPKTGRLHANFNGNGAKTGRMSSGGGGNDNGSVNLQNQPEEARKLFVAPPGYVIVSADFSQQEYRCLAYMTRDPLLVNAYKTGKDLYSLMASKVFGVPYEECGDGTEYRKKGKIGMLATVYGTSKYTLANQLGVSVDEAEKFLNDLFASMPVVAKWIEGNKRFVRKHGFVWMDKKQRKRRLPDGKKKRVKIPYGKWNDPKYAKAREQNSAISRAERQATNAIIQGSSAIQTKVTINAIYRWCMEKQKEGRDFRLWAAVHDEIIIQAPADITREEIAEYERLMTTSYPFGDIPLKTDIEIGTRWGELMPVDEWFAREAR